MPASFRSTPRRWIALLAVAALALAALGGTALAGHLSSGVKSYTGCLITSSGTITKVKEGNSPLGSPCSSGSVEVHFSGGDITAISAGTGLQGGGDNGAVTLAVAPSYRLPQSCTSGQVAKWDGSGWACAADSNSTYTAGTGLDLNGNEFSIEPAYRVKNTSDCSSGQFATGFDSDGDVQCAAPPSSAGVQAYSAQVGTVPLAGTTTVLSKVLPAGKYVLSASVELVNEDDDATSRGSCSMPGYTTGDSNQFGQPAAELGAQDEWGSVESLSLTSAITHTGGAVELKCTEVEANVNVHQAALTAIKVDSLD